MLGRYEPVVAVTRQGDRYETRGWLETVASVPECRQKGEGILETRAISSIASIGLRFRRVLSFDPQPVFFVPVLDRQFGITVETVVIGADLRFDPARFIAQQQMHARRRLR